MTSRSVASAPAPANGPPNILIIGFQSCARISSRVSRYAGAANAACTRPAAPCIKRAPHPAGAHAFASSWTQLAHPSDTQRAQVQPPIRDSSGLRSAPYSFRTRPLKSIARPSPSAMASIAAHNWSLRARSAEARPLPGGWMQSILWPAGTSYQSSSSLQLLVMITTTASNKCTTRRSMGPSAKLDTAAK